MKRIFILLILASVNPGCKKEVNKCEKWEVEYYCVALSVSAYCSATRNLTIYICNETDLADAHAGRETVTYETNAQREFRKYIRRVY